MATITITLTTTPTELVESTRSAFKPLVADIEKAIKSNDPRFLSYVRLVNSYLDGVIKGAEKTSTVQD